MFLSQKYPEIKVHLQLSYFHRGSDVCVHVCACACVCACMCVHAYMCKNMNLTVTVPVYACCL